VASSNNPWLQEKCHTSGDMLKLSPKGAEQKRLRQSERMETDISVIDPWQAPRIGHRTTNILFGLNLPDDSYKPCLNLQIGVPKLALIRIQEQNHDNLSIDRLVQWPQARGILGDICVIYHYLFGFDRAATVLGREDTSQCTNNPMNIIVYNLKFARDTYNRYHRQKLSYKQ